MWPTSGAQLGHGVPQQGRRLLGSLGNLALGRTVPGLHRLLLAAAEPERPGQVSGKALQQRQLGGRTRNLPSVA